MKDTEKKSVYQMIAEVAGKMAQEGISKNRENKQQGYQFRGIDDIYNALAPVMSSVGLVVLPRVIIRDLVERINRNGGALFYTTVSVEFDFISSHDGSKHTVVTYGEAMDSGDKSTNKAMSAAYKYACMQAFCIPTEGDNDADATTHEPVSQKKPETKPAPKAVPKAEEHPLKKRTGEILKEIGKQKERDSLDQYMADIVADIAEIRKVSSVAADSIDKAYEARAEYLMGLS